jgi:hypothetical protein
VNDTLEHVSGEVEVQVYDIRLETMFHSISFPAAILAGESVILKNISDLGQFPLNCVIRALLRDRDGNVLSSDFQLVRPERRYRFPEAKLSLTDNRDSSVTVTSDRFARCVELSGSHDGDKFGWRFEDNYFDMMPGEARTVRLLGKHRTGEITAKAHYSPHCSTITLK